MLEHIREENEARKRQPRIARKVITVGKDGKTRTVIRRLTLEEICLEDAEERRFIPNPEDPGLEASMDGGPDWERAD